MITYHHERYKHVFLFITFKGVINIIIYSMHYGQLVYFFQLNVSALVTIQMPVLLKVLMADSFLTGMHAQRSEN